MIKVPENYISLKTALRLMTVSEPSKINNQEFNLENLSFREKKRLDSQLKASYAWHPTTRKNIVGLGIAEKHTGSGGTGELSLTVYVKKKLPLDELSSAYKIPSRLEFEGLNKSLITDIREVGAVRLEGLSSKIRPIVCGYSIGVEDNVGTLGCMVVKRNGDHKQYILSNSHVLAKSGLGRPGDAIYQPGPVDARASNDPVAHLDSWQPFKFRDGFDNHIDAALGIPVDPELFSSAIFDIGKPKGTRNVERGVMVQKSGSATGHTWGRVEDVDFHTSLSYPRTDGKRLGNVNFSNLVLCSRYTDSGDSGSLVLDNDGYAVGLHFCGSRTASIFSPIQYVMDELQLDIVTD